jgi:hypothetical protein
MSAAEMTGDDTAPRPTGEAAWKAHRDAIDRQNAAAKKRAHEHKSAASVAATARERRLELREEEQLRALNARLDDRD